MNADRRESLRRSLQSLAESYAATMRLLQEAYALLTEEVSAGLPEPAQSPPPTPECHPDSRDLVVDEARLMVVYRGLSCYLGNTLPYAFVEINRGLRAMYPGLVGDLTRRLGEVGASVSQDKASGLLVINGEYSAALVLSRCRATPAGSHRWVVRLDRRAAPDITVLARMAPGNDRPADYFLLPLMDIDVPRVVLCETNGAHLDTYQFDSLDQFAALARRRRIEVPA